MFDILLRWSHRAHVLRTHRFIDVPDPFMIGCGERNQSPNVAFKFPRNENGCESLRLVP